MLIYLLFPALSDNNYNSINLQASYITLKIKGAGQKNIFCTRGSLAEENYPTRVKINGQTKTPVKAAYHLIQNIDIVILE